MTEFRAAIQKPLTLRCPNFVTFSFIFKTCSYKILAKFVSQGVAAALFSSIPHKNFENENFLCLKIDEVDKGCQFWVKKNESGHKNSFFQKLNSFFRM